jgi:hypothetical protein
MLGRRADRAQRTPWAQSDGFVSHLNAVARTFDPAIDEAITTAALTLSRDEGFARMSIEAVATPNVASLLISLIGSGGP